MGAEPADPRLLHRPPRPPQPSVLGAGLTTAIVATGALITLVVLGVAVTAAQRSE